MQTLGLARRAGALTAGTDAARRAVRDGTAHFVILAEDAAQGQKDKLLPLLRGRDVAHTEWGTREELGGAIGAGLSSALALTGKGFAEQIASQLEVEVGPNRP